MNGKDYKKKKLKYLRCINPLSKIQIFQSMQTKGKNAQMRKTRSIHMHNRNRKLVYDEIPKRNKIANGD